MIKIIQIDSSSGFGGGEMVMFDIIKGLKDKLQFTVVAPEGEFLEKYKQMNLQIYPLWQGVLLKNILRIRRVIQKEKPEIVHCHGTRAAFWTRLAVIGLKSKPKLIYTLHGFHIIRKPFFVKWPLLLAEKILNRWTDVLVCVSEADKNLVLRYKTISPEKIRVIKNGIDIEKFQVDEELAKIEKEKLGLTDKFVLAGIGRLHPPKDFSTILRALKLIVSRVQNVKLLIVGDGPLREALEKEVKELNVENYVEFLGLRKDIPVLINLSDILILSTYWEGLPLTPLEVGASKKPIIASNIEGVNETIIDGTTGFLFKPKSAEDLADKILRLYKDEELRQKMGEQGFNYASKHFSKERMVEEYKNLYEKKTDRSGA